MRSRLLPSLALGFSFAAGTMHAQSDGSLIESLSAGEYLRVAVGTTTPVNPQGSLRDWSRGTNYSLGYETWAPGGQSGTSRLGLGLLIDYARLPFDAGEFTRGFTPIAGGQVQSANASSATQFNIATTLRYRFSAPLVMPSLLLSLGYLDFKPATVHYTATSGSASATQQHRRGASLSIGGALDRHIADRVGVFGEAVYTYGFTSLGRGLTSPGGTCPSNGCDVLKNTTLGMLRAGLRVQMGGGRGQ